MTSDIWIWVHHRRGTIEDPTFGLLAEAERILGQNGSEGTITAIALGVGLEEELTRLGQTGAHRALYVESQSLEFYQGELCANILSELALKYNPQLVLMAHEDQTADLAPRVAALLGTGLVTKAMDLKMDAERGPLAVRPLANGYLFEEMQYNGRPPFIVTFLPAVLNVPIPANRADFQVLKESPAMLDHGLETRVIKRIEAQPEDLDLTEADIIIAGGRGVGKGERFEIVHALAKVLGGSVAGTRPVIDWQVLPYERQIGQTGKTVTPRLIVNCGISGANEYTAGMEQSRLVIAINTDPRSRIFRFSDLAVVGDVHQVIPLLIARLEALNAPQEADKASTDP